MLAADGDGPYRETKGLQGSPEKGARLSLDTQVEN